MKLHTLHCQSVKTIFLMTTETHFIGRRTNQKDENKKPKKKKKRPERK